MGKTAEDIQLDSTKTLKALFMAVGWNASPAGALIYAMSKYCALMGRAIFCVWVKLKYSDGSTTPGFVSSTFLGDSEEGLALLRAYTKRKAGQSALKYMPWV